MEENKNMQELNLEALEGVSGGKNQKVMATKAGVNIHSGPGKEFAVIAKTTKNAIANYTGELKYVEGEAWIHVKWDAKSGWIMAKYVKVV